MLKKIKKREESALSCNKITTLWAKPAPLSKKELPSLNASEEFELLELRKDSTENESDKGIISQSNKDIEVGPGPSGVGVISTEIHKQVYFKNDSDLFRSGGELLIQNSKRELQLPIIEQEIEITTSTKESAEGSEKSLHKAAKHESAGPGNVFSPTKTSYTETFDADFDAFKIPKKNDINFFFSKHPLVPSSEEFLQKDFPFSRNIFFIEKENISRRWLSYNPANECLYCYVCLAFSNGNSIFCKGFNDWRHITQRIGEHENSKSHNESVKLFLIFKKGKSLECLLFQEQLNKRQSEVLERRSVVMSIIEVIKVIGKQGLALRNKSEAAYNLNDPTLNHGNFLEILLLLAQYDKNLSAHIQKVSKKSEDLLSKRQQKGKKKFGRGNFVTFFGKTTLMNIINLIAREIRTMIAEEVQQASIYSVMMDTTLDVSTYDQCSIALRYVFDGLIQERVLALKHVVSTTGESLFQTLKNSLGDVGISIANCVADAFDGASNMNSSYKGVSAKLKEVNPNHIHTWCYAHVLNLVLTDTVQSLNACISFFGLLQETQVFLKDSQKRLAIYLEQNPSVRLEAIGETRWRSKSNATIKIFGHFHYWIESEESRSKKSNPVYVELISAVSLITNSTEFNPKVRNAASSLLQKFCSFETILVAMIFLLIFSYTTPLSDYLQTKDLDYVQAWRLISSTQKNLYKARNQFHEVYKAAERFTSEMNLKIEELSSTVSSLELVFIETQLPNIRARRIKKMPGEQASDEVVQSSKRRFETTVYNCVMDQVNVSLEERFTKNQSLYIDLTCLDPKKFDGLDVTSISLKRISELVTDCDEDKLKEELISFASTWKDFSNDTSREAIEESDADEFSLDDSEDMDNVIEPCTSSENKEENDIKSITCKPGRKCKSCFKCAYDVILEYNMYSRMYTELFKVYKYLLTLPVTQVTCERAFSKLKNIKPRLRSRLTDEHLESLFLMNSERDILVKIDNNVIIEKMCETSVEMKRLLQV